VRSGERRAEIALSIRWRSGATARLSTLRTR
jgi:hypothetical protein